MALRSQKARAVTRGAVRCSAWLGASGDFERREFTGFGKLRGCSLTVNRPQIETSKEPAASEDEYTKQMTCAVAPRVIGEDVHAAVVRWLSARNREVDARATTRAMCADARGRELRKKGCRVGFAALKKPLNKRVLLGSKLSILGNACCGVVHRMCVEAPNDSKLSHGGAWRGSCEVRRRRDIQTREMERTDETGAGQK